MRSWWSAVRVTGSRLGVVVNACPDSRSNAASTRNWVSVRGSPMALAAAANRSSRSLAFNAAATGRLVADR